MDKLAHRKAKCLVQVLDGQGNPLKNTRISMKQKNHEFLFGCGAFDFLEYTADTGGMPKDFLQDRIDKWLALYNYGTIPFYWGGFEPEEVKQAAENGVISCTLGKLILRCETAPIAAISVLRSLTGDI